MRLTVVICSWNRAPSLQKTLESIESCQVPEGTKWEILVVDNNSSDGTAAVCKAFLEKSPDRYRYVFEPRQGKSFALNTGIKYARGDIIAFTDDDVIVEQDWLGALLRAFDENVCAGVAGKIVAVWNSPQPAWFTLEGPYRLMLAIVRYDLGDQDQLCQVDTPPFGANLALRKSVFDKHGLFRVDLGPMAGTTFRGEDSEYCRRLMNHGEKLIYATRAVVFHPVEKERTKKGYFQSWYFDYGRMLVRTADSPSTTIRYFGVPRHMFRKLVTSFWRWNTSFEPKQRFYHRLQLWQVVGEIAESRNRFKKVYLATSGER